MQHTGVNLSGRPVLIDGGIYYYLISKHNTKGNAERTILNSDYPTHKKITKQGRYWCVVEKLNKEFQERMQHRKK